MYFLFQGTALATEGTQMNKSHSHPLRAYPPIQGWQIYGTCAIIPLSWILTDTKLNSLLKQHQLHTMSVLIQCGA